MASKPDRRALPAEELAALQAAVERLGTQTAVARELGVSSSTVSQALRGYYVGDVDKLAAQVRGAFMNEWVRCPIYADLPLKNCLELQVRPLAFTNPLRPKLFKACQTCPNNRKRQKKGDRL